MGGNLVWGPTPSNDAWSQAAVLDTARGTFAASKRYATIETGERIYDIGHSSLWWAFEAPEPGWYRFWIGEASLPFTISAYAHDPDAPPGGLDLIASSKRGIVDGIEIYLEAKEAGERFAVRVGTLGDAEGREFTLNWEASEGRCGCATSDAPLETESTSTKTGNRCGSRASGRWHSTMLG